MLLLDAKLFGLQWYLFMCMIYICDCTFQKFLLHSAYFLICLGLRIETKLRLFF
jgi:hypothetical protein